MRVIESIYVTRAQVFEKENVNKDILHSIALALQQRTCFSRD